METTNFASFEDEKKKSPSDLKLVVELIKDAYSLIVFNIHYIFIIGVLFAFLFFIYAKYQNPLFQAELRFVVKSEGSTSGISSALGGLGAMFGGATIGSPLERTVQVASSDRILGASLLTTVQIEGRSEVLANSLIRLNRLHDQWVKDTSLHKVVFSQNDTLIEYLSFPKRKALKILEEMIIPKSGEGIVSRSFDKKSGVVSLIAKHENEEFAIVLTKQMFYKLREFYVEQMISSAANNVLILQKKVDSIKFELSKVQSSFARNTDQSFGLLFQEDKVELRKLAVREQMLLAMYSEAQKNLETFKFMNDSAIPSLTVIDMPYSPLQKIEKSKVLFALGGFLLGAFLTFLFILIRRWYKNLMAS
jgi:hypothetical protein